MKKLLLLGGSRYIIPVIKAAHELGIYVITCDYIPDNIAHKYSDQCKNISIINKNEILEYACKEKIDGVMSFACDPGVVTAAYVAEKMGLPFQCSYKSASILQDKGLFRQFLTEHHFNVPHARRYTEKEAAFKDIDFFTWPVIVKPADSSGSKGVTRIDDVRKLTNAIDTAMNSSLSGAFIIEDFLTFDGYHSSTDPFTIDGELKFMTYSDHLFDADSDNPYIPAVNIWPSSMQEDHQTYLTSEIQRLMYLLEMKTGIYNIETCVGSDGKPYIMEVSPRGGGCKIAELQNMAYDVDLIESEVRKAVGLPVSDIKQRECDGYWCEFVIHTAAGKSGILEKIVIDPQIEHEYIKNIELAAKPGDYIGTFTGANMSLGDIFLRFHSREELDKVIGNANEWLKIYLR